jgi:hypothetical protein
MQSSRLVRLILTTAIALSPAAIPRALAGPAATVLRLETDSSARPGEAELATARCVSLLKAGALAAAGEACERAVLAAQRDRVETWNAPFGPHASGQELAVAYNNRAVFNYLSGRLTSAAADATRARSAASLPAIEDTAAVIRAARRRAALKGD